MKRKLLQYIEANKKEVVSLASRLIEIPTINPPGENYEKMAQFLEKRCRDLNLKIKKILTPPKALGKFGIKSGSKRINLIADFLVGSKNTLHISSHYDVVPATDKWKTDPFKAVVRGNRIYGRGSEDMKGNIACVLYALKAIMSCGIRPKINLQISFTPDEEIGGMTGLGYLVKNGLVKADYAMSEGYSGEYVSMGNKGVLWAEVVVTGKACHASIPHKGINAFERMTELVSELNKLKKKLSGRKTCFYMRDKVSKSPSLVMGGVLQGGVKTNVVPGTAKFSIDRRLIPEESAEIAAKEVEAVIKRFNAKHRDSHVSIKFTAKDNPSISKKDEAFFRTVSDSIMLVTGKKARFSIMSGATDMRYFMRKGVPAIGYGAKGGESWHSDNEFVYIDSLIDTAKVYALIMSEMK